MSSRHLLTTALFLASIASADPLTRQQEIDFYRDVPARNLTGFAARSDGRLFPGPAIENLSAVAPADLLWCLQPAAPAGTFLVGTGPDGKILSFNPASNAAPAVYADLTETHVFALAILPDGAVLAGTSPQGALVLLRDGKVVARVTLPADSILDLLALDAATALVATGNPGKIYRVDLAAFAKSGDSADKVTDPAAFAAKGVSLFGEIRDRNVRRLALLPDGRVLAGSAPKGNVYAFPAKGGSPLLLLEGRESEVTDFLVQPDGSFYAAITFATSTGESRVNRPAPTPPQPAPGPPPAAVTPLVPEPEAPAATRFAGRSQLVLFPANGLPDVVVARGNVAFYRLARHGDWLLLTGGEQGELLAYDPVERRSLNLGASTSAQVNALAPLGAGAFLLQRNNPAGWSRLSFAGNGERRAETRRIDLGAPVDLGQLRFGPGPDVPGLALSVRTSFGSDELEGWSDWTPLQRADGGWFAAGLRGRHLQFRVTAPAAFAPAGGLDKAVLHFLSQNRRPVLGEFRILPANYTLLPAPEQPQPITATLGQFLAATSGSARDDSGKKNPVLNSQVVPQPGQQIVYWTASDSDGDTLAYTFSLRAPGADQWTDLAVATRDNYAQFDFSHLADGVYDTRLVIEEQAPRPPADRLRHTFQTDGLVVDKTAPLIKDATATPTRVSVSGADALSLLQGAEFLFNNGHKETVEHPLDGIRDSRVETFVAEPNVGKTATATSVEIILYDAAGNTSARRLPLK